ncbi:MAG: class I SAM-dependent RNA methyltransferase [Clostridiaceae bacterium]|nr:class I SAM-dependent RNA methyltransferase [Clostridiaceae bacterium]
MSNIELVAPCNFAVEAILSREIKSLGYEISKVEDGRVSFVADEKGICRSNLWLRTAERILVKIGEFEALSFDELFEKTKRLEWYRWIPKDAEFPVAKASSIKSKLFSTSDIQAIVKKAVVESLKTKYKQQWFEETGERYPIHVFLNRDKAALYLDTSGLSLHKRGYRELSNAAPIKETLAAAMVLLTPWKADRALIDPFCGSGTIPIEAAMIGLNIAPGHERSFVSGNWKWIGGKLWNEAKEEAASMVRHDAVLNVQGYDIDESALKVARINAKMAGLEDKLHFQKRDVKELSSKDRYGFIVTNPPYGERISDMKSVERLYKDMGKVFSNLETWSFYIITSHEEFERFFGRRADKKRKLYNGMMKTDLYQFFGPKPNVNRHDPLI